LGRWSGARHSPLPLPWSAARGRKEKKRDAPLTPPLQKNTHKNTQPWCGHCKNLEPEYEAAATTLAGAKSPIKLVKVDATLDDNKPLAEKYAVRGFPTLKIFRDGSTEAPADYKGPRDAAGIVSYLEKVSGPPSTELKSVADVAGFKEGKEVALVGAFPSASSKEFKAFEAAAKALREDHAFAHVFVKKGAASLEELKDGGAGVVMYKTYDAPAVVADVDLTGPAAAAGAGLQAWIATAATPALVELDQTPRNRRALDAIFKADTPKLLGFVPKGHKQEAAFRKALTDLAEAAKAIKKDAKGAYDVIAVDPAANAGAVQFFGLATDGSDLPAIAVHAPKNNAKFIKAKAKAGDIKSFLASYHAGKLTPHVKSEAPPKKNDGPVKIVTAKTYDSIVAKGKTTLLEVYAPWCGHCKSLAPTYEKVGAAFKGDKNVVIAKFDGTANDLPPSAGLEVKGFPTIALITPEGKVIPYTGERSEEAMVAFVKSGGKPAKAAEAAEEEPAKDEL
jgi:protein disulfide-isomerase A1